MAKEKAAFILTGIELDPGSELPVYRQVYQLMRQGILDRRLRPGQRLPPTRELAGHLGISRSTVLLAFEHLMTEGYIEGRTGSGTFVSQVVPDTLLEIRGLPGKGGEERLCATNLSRQGKAILDLPYRNRRDTNNLRPFRAGVPALRDFPYETWSRLLAQESRNLTINDFGYGHPAGYRPLREAIAVYLRTARAVRCETEQVIITSGSQQALDLTCRLLLNPGDPAWVEDPGYNGAKEALTAAAARIIPVPIDDEGLIVQEGVMKAPESRLVYITPSHQYPVGVTMSLQRRLELLEWAAQHQTWILEDDYDSEYRYGGRPLSSLQGIDDHGCVIYMGTFSKVMFPGLRLGYLVVPPGLIDAFTAAKAFSDRQNAILEQAVLARFMTEGHFGRHLRRMRLLYQERQEALVSAVKEDLQGFLGIAPSDTGLHLVGWLPENQDDERVAGALKKHGIYAGALSDYTLGRQRRPGLVLGYAPYRPEEIRKTTMEMERIFRNERRNFSRLS